VVLSLAKPQQLPKRTMASNALGQEARMECLDLYVLTTLSIHAEGNVVCRNVGATFDIFEAEVHKADGVENDFDTFVVSGDWREDAGQSSLVTTMRDFREMVRQMQEAALR
jgi:hypothetical protein